MTSYKNRFNELLNYYEKLVNENASLKREMGDLEKKLIEKEYLDWENNNTFIARPSSEYSSYQDIIESFGWEVLIEHYVGGYQGDILFLLKKGSYYGVLVQSYGSCSGCDALQWHEAEGTLADLAYEMDSRVYRLDTKEEVKKYIRNKDWEGSSIGNGKEVCEFKRKVNEIL